MSRTRGPARAGRTTAGAAGPRPFPLVPVHADDDNYYYCNNITNNILLGVFYYDILHAVTHCVLGCRVFTYETRAIGANASECDVAPGKSMARPEKKHRASPISVKNELPTLSGGLKANL